MNRDETNAPSTGPRMSADRFDVSPHVVKVPGATPNAEGNTLANTVDRLIMSHKGSIPAQSGFVNGSLENVGISKQNQDGSQFHGDYHFSSQDPLPEEVESKDVEGEPKLDTHTTSSSSPTTSVNETQEYEFETVASSRPIVTPLQGCLQLLNTPHPSPAKTSALKPLILASCELPGKSCLQVVTYEKPTSVPRVRSPFAQTVHAMVCELHTTDPAVMKWVLNGEAFHVDSAHPRLGIALSKYFHHSKYSSFQRQLNSYGWNKSRNGRYAGFFFNPLFHRDYNQVFGLVKSRQKQTQEDRDERTPPVVRKPRSGGQTSKRVTRRSSRNRRATTRSLTASKRSSPLSQKDDKEAKRKKLDGINPRPRPITRNSVPRTAASSEPCDGRIVLDPGKENISNFYPQIVGEASKSDPYCPTFSHRPWGKKQLLLQKLEAIRSGQALLGAMQHSESQETGALVPLKRHALDTLQETPTKEDNGNRTGTFCFGTQNFPSTYTYATANERTRGLYQHETYPTPQRSLIEQPLMSFSPPLPPIEGYEDNIFWNDNGGQTHGHLRDDDASPSFDTASLSRGQKAAQNAVRVAYHGSPAKISPLRPFPVIPRRTQKGLGLSVSDEEAPMASGPVGLATGRLKEEAAPPSTADGKSLLNRLPDLAALSPNHDTSHNLRTSSSVPQIGDSESNTDDIPASASCDIPGAEVGTV